MFVRQFHTPILNSLLFDADDGAGGGGGDGGDGNDGRLFSHEGQGGDDGGQGGSGGASDADLARVSKREKAAGRRQAERDIAEKLGMTPDEAAAKLKAIADSEAAALTEVERREREATEREARAVAREAEALRRERDATIRSVLAGAGVTDADVQADLALLARIPEDTSSDDLEDVVTERVEALKERYPEKFKPGSNDGGGRGPSHLGGNEQRREPPKGADALARGAERAKALGDRFSAPSNPFEAAQQRAAAQ